MPWRLPGANAVNGECADAAEAQLLAALLDEAAASLTDARQALCRAIRQGDFDAPGAEQDRLFVGALGDHPGAAVHQQSEGAGPMSTAAVIVVVATWSAMVMWIIFLPDGQPLDPRNVPLSDLGEDQVRQLAQVMASDQFRPCAVLRLPARPADR